VHTPLRGRNVLMAGPLLNRPCRRTLHRQVRTEGVPQDMHSRLDTHLPGDPSHSFAIRNGLLLRRDLHALFDANQIGIDQSRGCSLCPKRRSWHQSTERCTVPSSPSRSQNSRTVTPTLQRYKPNGASSRSCIRNEHEVGRYAAIHRSIGVCIASVPSPAAADETPVPSRYRTPL
jgi:hypothetical protein